MVHSHFHSVFPFTVPLMWVHIVHPQPIRKDMVALVNTVFPFHAVFFSLDRPDNLPDTEKYTKNGFQSRV
jgi:hypothetical protein